MIVLGVVYLRFCLVVQLVVVVLVVYVRLWRWCFDSDGCCKGGSCN